VLANLLYSTSLHRELLVQLGQYDVYGLSEVAPVNTRRYLLAVRDAHGIPYDSFVSVTGGSDRLLMIYSKQRLELLDSQELEAHNGVRMNSAGFRHRSPLVGHFRDMHSGAEFLVVLVHLARGNADVRIEQAKGLRLWAADQDLPVVGIGDFNFDYDFATGQGNAAFDEFLVGDVWEWVQPEELIDTQWSDRDGADAYPDGCLDFAFVAGAAKAWQCNSRVTVRDGDFPDDETTSDHRPVELTVVP